MYVKFRKGTKVAEYSLVAVPREGDNVQLTLDEDVSGKVTDVTWCFGDPGGPFVKVTLI